MKNVISDAIKQLLQIVWELHNAYPHRNFTLDGRLVGDLGEVLVAEAYDIQLDERLRKSYDGITSDGRLVQIKATMKNALTFPSDTTPDYYLGIKIHPDGRFTEVFNGPGSVAQEAVKQRKPTRDRLYSVPINTLEKLNKKVQSSERIPLRKNKRRSI